MAQKNLFSSTQPQLQKTVSFFPSGTGSTGGGLFGKQGDDKPSSGGILGTNPAAETKQVANPVGLFGGKKDGTEKTSSLFGPKTDGAATTTAATTVGATTGTTGGFFGAKTETAATTGGLFGPKPTTTGLFGQTAPTGGLFVPKPTTGLFTGVGAGAVNPLIPDDKANKDMAEIEVVMQNYASYIDPTNARNSFVHCMYNKYGPNINPQFKEQIKRLIPIKDIAVLPENTKITGDATGTKKIEVFIDQKDFAKCKRENPNSDEYYVKQINTFEELYERLNNFKKTSKNVKEIMTSSQAKMVQIKNGSENKLKNGVKTLRDNMRILRSRILEIQAKLNLASDNTYYSQEERERLNTLFEETTAPQKIPGRVEEIKGKLEELLEKRSTSTRAIPSEAFASLENEDKRRVISILKEQTKGIQCLINTTKKNAHKLEVIEKIVQEIKSEQAKEAEYRNRRMH